MVIIFTGLAAAFGIVQVIPYLRGILRGDVKPSRTAYTVWAIVESIALVSLIGTRSLVPAVLHSVFALSALTIALLSIKRGLNIKGGTDIICLIIAGIALIAWLVSGNAQLAVIGTATTVAVGYVSTYVKTKNNPGTENLTSWWLATVASAFSVLGTIAIGYQPLLPALILPTVSLIGATTIAVLTQCQQDNPKQLQLQSQKA